MSQKAGKEGPRLSKNQRLSEHFSIHCCPPFTFLNSKREIVDRKYSICRSGCFYQKQEEDWVCCACQKTRPSRRATSPQKPKQPPAAPPAVVRAPAKPRSPPRSERQPRPRPEVRPPPAKQRPPQKAKKQPRSSPGRGPGASRGGSPVKASRFW
ncbi:PREDICTED: myelin-associated oligodendrocyte basic protein isoform X2 [Propithecus coquereli]|uniref:Myelin associated oligodendrocyte basic protein n=1 Tax=Propithecus coquereli TaxID=379532 RepID=A0A2K6FNG8_PROCO|nr:PREDICTED: myelin-associated oligodendrocyte basic protein isoform X2 [Propithecus coquereli]XP_012499415.1 PREDICTED: myelin-associated oligodendrocyte basic protein isoform X2 [Propithecus coquereli]XP_012499479.1 PREDICTED: myelin-associated oligodendrocyte basic protein isoform X2 [Propithecus coquereli]XP_012499553.1 PREDICTED: myelin-associated oligodendrocyte basic protein isoform X2 [Propithecus coquereli]XP_012499629.1 PREDICTED: myelin-associated oligodendrocyte basic protein isofo